MEALQNLLEHIGRLVSLAATPEKHSTNGVGIEREKVPELFDVSICLRSAFIRGALGNHKQFVQVVRLARMFLPKPKSARQIAFDKAGISGRLAPENFACIVG